MKESGSWLLVSASGKAIASHHGGPRIPASCDRRRTTIWARHTTRIRLTASTSSSSMDAQFRKSQYRRVNSSGLDGLRPTASSRGKSHLTSPCAVRRRTASGLIGERACTVRICKPPSSTDTARSLGQHVQSRRRCSGQRCRLVRLLQRACAGPACSEAENLLDMQVRQLWNVCDYLGPIKRAILRPTLDAAVSASAQLRSKVRMGSSC